MASIFKCLDNDRYALQTVYAYVSWAIIILNFPTCNGKTDECASRCSQIVRKNTSHKISTYAYSTVIQNGIRGGPVVSMLGCLSIDRDFNSKPWQKFV